MIGPFEIVENAIAALNQRDWLAAAQFFDREDLNTWYAGFFNIAEEPQHDVTYRDIKRYQPDMPDEVAEYQAAQIRRQREEARGTLHGQFAGLDSRPELAAVTPVEALARHFQARDPEWIFERSIKNMDPRIVPYAQPPEWSQWRKAVGAMLETDDVAHVVYSVSWRQDVRYIPGEGEMSVATLRRTSEGWQIRLRGELFEHSSFGVFMSGGEDAEQETES